VKWRDTALQAKCEVERYCTADEVRSGEILHCDLGTAGVMPALHNSRHTNFSINIKMFIS
jgi:hypothetical protein